MALSPAAVLVNTSGGIQQVAPATGSTSTFAFVSASNNTLLASNPNRAGVSIFNDSTGNYLVKFGSGIADNSFTFYIPPAAMYDMPMPTYTGQILGRSWGSGSGTIYVTELTP